MPRARKASPLNRSPTAQNQSPPLAHGSPGAAVKGAEKVSRARPGLPRQAYIAFLGRVEDFDVVRIQIRHHQGVAALGQKQARYHIGDDIIQGRLFGAALVAQGR